MSMRIVHFDWAANRAKANGSISYNEAKEELMPLAREAEGSTKAAVLRRVDEWASDGLVRDQRTVNVIAKTVEQITDGEKTFTPLGVRLAGAASVATTAPASSAKSPELEQLEGLAKRYNRLTHPDRSKVEVYSLGNIDRGLKQAALEAAGLPRTTSTSRPPHADASEGIDSIMSWHIHQAGITPLNAELKGFLESAAIDEPTAASFQVSDRTLRRHRNINNGYPVKMLGFVSTTAAGEAIAVVVSGGG